MNVQRASKQNKAYWRSENKLREQWMKEKPETDDEIEYGQHLRTVERLRGHAAGWIAGVKWARRQRAAKKAKEANR